MKKIIIAAAVIFTSGIISLHLNVKNAHHAASNTKQIFYDYRKELASAD
jgi:hypothetical protein